MNWSKVLIKKLCIRIIVNLSRARVRMKIFIMPCAFHIRYATSVGSGDVKYFMHTDHTIVPPRNLEGQVGFEAISNSMARVKLGCSND